MGLRDHCLWPDSRRSLGPLTYRVYARNFFLRMITALYLSGPSAFILPLSVAIIMARYGVGPSFDSCLVQKSGSFDAETYLAAQWQVMRMEKVDGGAQVRLGRWPRPSSSRRFRPARSPRSRP
jgi:hypothetical protein